jgi:hypothetical protein
MVFAMHKRTRIGCEDIIQQAISQCPVPTIQQYIVRNYQKNTRSWALWARQHSPLLLQVTSTNALESYHSELKRTTSPTFGLIGASHKVVELDVKRRSDAEIVAFDFRTKKLSVANVNDEILVEVHKFPLPIQKLLVGELCAVEKRLEKGKGAPGLTLAKFECLFHHKYLLPCKHIFHEHMYGANKLLAGEGWRRFQRMFEESGFEVYESRGLVEVERVEQTEEERGVENRRVAVNELMERTRDQYWRVEERGDIERSQAFVRLLESSLEDVLGFSQAR